MRPDGYPHDEDFEERKYSNEMRRTSKPNDTSWKWSSLRKYNTSQKYDTAILLRDIDHCIARRINELDTMGHNTPRRLSTIIQLPPEIQKIALKYIEQTKEEFTKTRRINWKPKDFLLYAFRSVMTVCSISIKYKRYLNFEMAASRQGGRPLVRVSNSEPIVSRNSLQEQSNTKMDVKESIGDDIIACLSKQCEVRTKADLEKITLFLKDVNPFIRIFTTESIEETAKYVTYEKYECNRLIARQGRIPTRLYYVISGKVDKLWWCSLSDSTVNRSLGWVSKGETTNPNFLIECEPYETNLVAYKNTQVLVLEHEDVLKLLRFNHKAPIDFLKSIPIFKDFSFDFVDATENSTLTTYFSPNEIILFDPVKTPWLHIVKEGSVKLVRKQNIVKNDQSQHLFTSSQPENVGISKSNDHATDMYGLTGRQKCFKKKYASQLPIISTTECNVFRPGEKRRRHRRGVLSEMLCPEINPKLKTIPHDKDNSDEDCDLNESDSISINNTQQTIKNNRLDTFRKKATFSKSVSLASSKTKVPPKSKSPVLIRICVTESENSVLSFDESQLNSSVTHSFVTSIFPDSELQEASQVLLPRKHTQFHKRSSERSTYLHLDTLASSDVFGLNNLSRIKKDEEKKISKSDSKDYQPLMLISNGAEIVRIRKSFFAKNASNNLLIQLEQTAREYMTNMEAKELMAEKNIWQQYKKMLIKVTEDRHSSHKC